MAIDPVTAGLNTLNTVIDKIWPNANEAERNRMQVILRTTLAVHETNIAEAKHKSIFVAGWRPAVGWICALGLLYEVFGLPLLTWLSTAIGFVPPPGINTEVLTTLLFALLGVGGLRTIEKFGGVARNHMDEKIPKPRGPIKRVIDRVRGNPSVTEDDFVINP